jgi:alkanesulfonate monooxygenase SsuD/methylene tetrahydromethanopterin reductase-like flavin-dependent oxidoreductase (luciferase family)
MKFGLMIRGQHQPGEDMPLRHRDDLELARRAEALGFDSVGKASHYSTHPFQMLQQIPFLAQVAAIAPKLRLLCGVLLLPLHKPLDVAEQLATLDVMSDGKLIFGAGVGYREVEFKAFGTRLAQAGRRFEENLEAVKQLWREEFVTMTGSHFELDGANCSIKPVQKPMPPIWIGANADVGIRRAARMADAWFVNPHNTLATLERQMDTYKRELERCGKPFPPPEFPMAREVFVARSRDEAIRLAGPALEEKYRAYRAWGQDKVMPAEDHFDVTFEELLNNRFLLGTPAEVAGQLIAQCRQFGTNYVCVGVHLPGMEQTLALEQMEMLAEEVFPAVRHVKSNLTNLAPAGGPSATSSRPKAE